MSFIIIILLLLYYCCYCCYCYYIIVIAVIDIIGMGQTSMVAICPAPARRSVTEACIEAALGGLQRSALRLWW